MKNLRIHILCIDQYREKKVVGEAEFYPQLIGEQRACWMWRRWALGLQILNFVAITGKVRSDKITGSSQI